MKKIIKAAQLFLSFILLFFISATSVSALTIDSIGGDDSIEGLGSTVKTYNTTLTTFTVAGTASPSTEVRVAIGDLNNNTAADTLGNWGVNFSGVSYGDNDLVVSSGGETLDLVVTVAEVASVSTASTTTTLPEAGALENTLMIFAFGILTLGLGMAIKFRN
jgi:hypothetical protein